jgi:hypothetical protein
VDFISILCPSLLSHEGTQDLSSCACVLVSLGDSASVPGSSFLVGSSARARRFWSFPCPGAHAPVAFRCLLHPTRPRSDSPIRTAPVSPSRARSAGSFFFGLSSLPSSRVLPPARTCVNPSTGRSAAALFFGFSLPAIFSGCEFLRYSAWSCCRSADWSPASSLAQLPLFVLFA